MTKLIHWTDASGLHGILSEMQIWPECSFVTADVPLDQLNDKPFGIEFDFSTRFEEYAFNWEPPDDEDDEELQHDRWVNRYPIPLDALPPSRFVVRDETRLEELRAILAPFMLSDEAGVVDP